MSKSNLVVLSGPSGSGKSSVIKEIEKELPCSLVVSTTTREPRSGEINGIDYHFLSRKSFQDLAAAGEFIEYMEFNGNFYGIHKPDLQKHVDGDKTVILDLSCSGARKVKGIHKEATLVFLLPPSYNIARQRLLERGMTHDEIVLREQDDDSPLSEARFYDLLVVNHTGKLKETASTILRHLNV
ncbi:guanylate kinase [Candidatus Nomurabacteria bacterium]|nr:guanylate kinase [Candidatus Kaiserbacteria bacterium]MCB9811106.1 guanylate kinase [Candidatus Nomurabacteria bacterium]MCB9814458.1 guanylate kinase [Candidatus Nomurabacteria bacterium]